MEGEGGKKRPPPPPTAPCRLCSQYRAANQLWADATIAEPKNGLRKTATLLPEPDSPKARPRKMQDVVAEVGAEMEEGVEEAEQPMKLLFKSCKIELRLNVLTLVAFPL
jgi:hypothetical protein